jgi:ABC-type transport system substrate-binding protein
MPCALALVLVSLLGGCTRAREVHPPKENVLRMALLMKITTLDPHLSNDIYSHQTEGLTYESLYAYHYLKRPLELVPVLADGPTVMSKDRKSFTVKLKKGVLFQDDPCFKSTGGKGREVTAEDISYMIHRISAPKFASPTFSSFENRVVGVDDFHAGKAPTISGVRVLDKYTIRMDVLKPNPRFMYNFVNAHTAIVAKECVDFYGQEFGRHPVGTGPFKITEYDSGSRVVAVRNPNFRKDTYPTEGMPGDKEKGLLDDAGKPVPFVDKVIYEILIESQPRWLKFMAGEHDFITIPKDNLGSALPNGKLSEDLEKRGVKLFREVQADVTTLIFNMEDPVWGKHKELRQAIALALDVPRIIEVMYGGQATRAHSLVDPTQYGFDPKWKSRWTDRNIPKAKELLAKAGYPDGKGLPPLEYIGTSSTLARQMTELESMQLKEIGIQLKPDFMTWPEFDKRMREKKFAVVGLGYASDTPDADATFVQYHSRNVAPGPNISNYRNPEADKLIDEIEQMDNGPARLAKIAKLREILDEDLPMIPMVHRIGNQLAQPWVRNHIYTDALDWVSWLKYKKILYGAPTAK